ncbi:glycosyltransferase [Clostridium perfringens]|uniref:glycosyltransferase n=1 Tax=Clostridium perfringens TaxID=1502 RepID=UPI002341FBC2|nr:glycosyltransferase family 2 protein [Clostridium perfringens]ELC8386907.1 glycosyltransferase family 2 protein [Clostridium perfringens]ELC8407917.1 glycosyltransferase family 2 protein [Clostridium perfringens]MDC4244635.1 glycosyltransferase family 2 protein [Clostridium perfringens]MDK0917022.1 glycosyltransferase family 2 protein [Clostridium perfringens]
MQNSLAIIILNYNNYKMTVECVENLINHDIKDKIIVIDNKSRNESFNVLKNRFKYFNNVKVISSDYNNGYAYGNNFAVKLLVNENIKNICIMNPDIIINDNNIFSDLIYLKEKYNLKGITATQILNNSYDMSTLGWKLPNFKDLIILNSNIISKIYNPIKYKSLKMISKKDLLAKIDVMPGCFFLIDKDFFEKIGFFDERTFLYYEENIISKKAKLNNGEFGVCLKSFYIHNHIEKDKSISRLRNKINDRKIILYSQKIYAYNYLNINFLKKYILNISQNFNLYFELPIIHILKFINRRLK